MAKPFETPHKYDVIIYGLFAYYADDEEMSAVKENTVKMLKENSFVFVYDSLHRGGSVKTDARNAGLKVYKRTLSYWSQYFEGFDLLDFRLFDNNNSAAYRKNGSLFKADLSVTDNDDDWIFAALFKKRP